MAEERAKVIVSFELNAEMQVMDDGYLGTGVTVEAHMEKARREIENWVFLVQQGTTVPQRLRANTKVTRVTIIPEER